MKKTNWLRLIEAIILCLLVGAISSVLTMSSVSGWYATLVKPSFNPPNWIFGPVWTTLFIMMGIALFLILEEGKKKKEAKKA